MYYKYIVVSFSDYQCMYVKDENESKKGEEEQKMEEVREDYKEVL